MWNNKLVIIAVVICLWQSHAVHAQCTINVNGDLGEPQPLLIKPGTSLYYEPTDTDGIIRMNLNQQMELYCTTGFQTPAGITENLITVNCTAGNLFLYNGYKYGFSSYACKAYPYHIAKKNGARCYNNGYMIDIGYEVGTTRFIKVLSVCHNEVTEETYYAKHSFTPANSKYQSGFNRPGSFYQGSFFGDKYVDYLYRRDTQRETIAKILNSQTQADNYIHPTNDFFMARGHLAAKADFIFGNQQSATFYFVNAAPQWQKFNALNWVAVEDYTRKLAATRMLDLDVYTGTFGRLRLKDDYSKQHDIYLSINGTNQIPAPKLYYKMLINHAENSGIVLIGVNNPYLTLTEIQNEYIICHDISSEITWAINWQRDNIERGYSYACSVSDFLRVVPHVSLSISRLLI